MAAHRYGRTATVVNINNDQNLNTKPIVFNPEHELITIVFGYPVLGLGYCCLKIHNNLTRYDVDYIRSTSEVDKSFWEAIR